MRKQSIRELESMANYPTISAVEALRRNLLFATLQSVSQDDMTKVVEKQVEKAKGGDPKAAKLLLDMVNASPPGERQGREQFIRESGSVTDYKVEIRKLIVCLIAFNGPQSTEDVAARLHLTGTLAMDSLMCGWFSREGGKWGLTNEARTRVLDVQARITHVDNNDEAS